MSALRAAGLATALWLIAPRVLAQSACEYPSPSDCPSPTPRPGYVPAANGCGAEGGLSAPDVIGSASFLQACNTHDICYGTCNSVKRDCDQAFLQAMEASCRQQYEGEPLPRAGCIAVARSYYNAVSLGGSGPYAAAQSNACECCRAPGGPPAPPGNVGAGHGDVHLRTFDGIRYDMQGVGEFTLARQAIDGFEVQARTRPWNGSRSVSVNIALAARVGSDRVGFYLDGTTRLNGATVVFSAGLNSLPDGGQVYASGNEYKVVWPDNSQLHVQRNSSYMDADVFLADARRSAGVAGLLGDFDGNPADDLATRNGGTVLTPPAPFEAFYGSYVESWRIAQADSLFDYAMGETTESFSDRSFPAVLATSSSLSASQYDSARAACLAAGVSQDWLDSCIVDVGFTGDPSFAESLADAPPASTEFEVAEPLPVPCNVSSDCPVGAACVASACGQSGFCSSAQACTTGEVCGCDGITYPSDCAAYSAGNTAFKAGACPPLDLLQWSKEGPPGNGTWQVAADGLSVLQTINGDPTFFISPGNFINTTIEGSFRVETTSDDDFIGFVLGYQSPLASGSDPPNSYDFVLFDWKKSQQLVSGGGQEGFTLSRVQGTFSDPVTALWSHSAAGVMVLGTDYGSTRGWTENVDHTFQAIYEADRLRVSVDGALIFDVSGSFPTGRFGFYNLSQERVRYRSFTAQGG